MNYYYGIIAIVVIIAIVAFLLNRSIGKYALSSLVIAVACFIMALITDWDILLLVTKLCGAAVILIFAYEIIVFIFAAKGKGNE